MFTQDDPLELDFDLEEITAQSREDIAADANDIAAAPNASAGKLDAIKVIRENDEDACIDSLELIGNQINSVWDRRSELTISDKYKSATKIVVVGMGGSVLGTKVILSLFREQLQAPIEIVADYGLPQYVDENTVVIASSYSGNTEETLEATREAHERGAMLTGLCAGGELASFLSKNDYPHLVFDTENNPSGVSRMGFGSAIAGQMVLFAALGQLRFGKQEFEAVSKAVAAAQLEYSLAVPQSENPAKMLALQCYRRMPKLLVAEHLVGAADVFVHQLHENGKTLADYSVVPDMNHHELEALAHPDTVKHQIFALGVDSTRYHSQNQKRMQLTLELFHKAKIDAMSHTFDAESNVAEAFSLIMLGAYTAFYLSVLYDEAPLKTDRVAWLKDRL